MQEREQFGPFLQTIYPRCEGTLSGTQGPLTRSCEETEGAEHASSGHCALENTTHLPGTMAVLWRRKCLYVCVNKNGGHPG